MKFNELLLAGIFFGGTIVSMHADILERWSTNQITTNGYKMDSITYGNGIYVATAEDYGADPGKIYSSVDGTHWTQVYYNSGIWGLNLHYIDGCFVGATGGYGQVAISPDGTNWNIPQPAPNGYLDDAISTKEEVNVPVSFVAVGGDYYSDTEGAIFYSFYGTNWTAGTISPSVGGGISSVAYGTPRTSPPPPLNLFSIYFVAVGNNDGNTYTSPDGISWTRRSIPGGSQVSFGNGLFIVPLNSQNNLVSTDGTNWTQYSTGLTNQLGWITYSHGVFMSQAGSYLATSSDGINWTQYSQPLPGVTSTLATDGKRIVTVGSIFTGGSGFSYFYNGYVYLSDPLVGVRMTNSPASQVALSGLVGRNYQIQSANVPTSGSNYWRTNMAIQLTNTPYVWADSTATNSARFYRGVLLP